MHSLDEVCDTAIVGVPLVQVGKIDHARPVYVLMSILYLHIRCRSHETSRWLSRVWRIKIHRQRNITQRICYVVVKLKEEPEQEEISTRVKKVEKVKVLLYVIGMVPPRKKSFTGSPFGATKSLTCGFKLHFVGLLNKKVMSCCNLCKF